MPDVDDRENLRKKIHSCTNIWIQIYSLSVTCNKSFKELNIALKNCIKSLNNYNKINLNLK